METTIATRIKALQEMSVSELRVEYQEVYGEETSAANKGFLLKKIAWRIQELEYGGLPEEVKKRALKIAGSLNLTDKLSGRPVPVEKQKRAIVVQTGIRDKRLPMPGAILTREYKGELIRVEVLEDGFEFKSCKYRSLSAIAKAVTGSHWNGYLFFNIK